MTDMSSVHPARAVALARAAMIAAAALWGLATVLTKDIVETVPPFTLLAVQLSASVAALTAALAVTGRVPMRLGPAIRAGRTGLLEPGLAYAVGVPGLMLTTAGSASLIAATEPAFVILCAWLLFAARPSARLLAAVGSAIAGVALVTSGSGAEGTRHIAGDALILLGTIFAALYVTLSARQTAAHEPLPLAVSQQAHGLALAAALVAACIATGLEPWHALDTGTLARAALSGVLQYALPFWLYLTAVRRIDVSEAALYLTLTPLFGVAGGVAFLGETVHPAQVAGGALILGAIVVATRK